jgi:hypothetical protein
LRARRPIAGAVLLAIVAGLIVFGLDSVGAGSTRVAQAPAGRRPASAAADGRRRQERRSLAEALRQGTARAAALGGAVEAAVTLGSWSRPLVAASGAGGASRQMRMWSMSKVATMVALLRAQGWGDEPGKPLSSEVEAALQRAITRSENCPQRRVVLELQRATGGPQGARRAVAATLAEAGARVRPGAEISLPETSCLEYLESQRQIADPLGPAVLLGTSTWRVADAVRFMQGLADGVYGKAVTRRVLSELREPKRPSQEVLPDEYTAAPDWGAGRAFAGWHPAYKAGWGGSEHDAFLAGQIAVVEAPDGRRAELAVMFHPAAQPAEDDPGLTAAPRALELVMASLRRALADAS